jgi:hypothetical protein
MKMVCDGSRAALPFKSNVTPSATVSLESKTFCTIFWDSVS